MGSVRPYDTARGRRYRVRWRDEGRAQREKRGFRTRREAVQFAASVEVTLSRGTDVPPSEASVTVGELAVDWLENKAAALKPSSYAPIRTAWRVHVEPRWSTSSIGSIRPSAVEKWIRELGQGTAPSARVRTVADATPRSSSVVLRSVGILAGILDSAQRDGRITTNPARGATNLPRKPWKSRRRYLTDDEVFRFADCAPDKVRATLILVLAYTGLRWGEAVALRVQDFEVHQHRITVRQSATEVDGRIYVGAPKSWAARRVPAPAFVFERLQSIVVGRQPGDLIFPGKQGHYMMRPATAQGQQSWWLTSIRNAGIEHLTPHDLRHTAASLAVSAGAHVKLLQRMMGHRSAAMTLDTYADLYEEDLGPVAERLNERVLARGLLTAHGAR